MNLHEYQAKELLSAAGLPVGEWAIAESHDQVDAAIDACGDTSLWVAKVQTHAGGRGKVGGVKLARTREEVHAFAKQWLGGRIVTKQTGEAGQPIHSILVAAGVDIAREFYLSVLLDRNEQSLVVVASSEGGGDIEEVAATNPEAIVRVHISPVTGYRPDQGTYLAGKLGLGAAHAKQFSAILGKLVAMTFQHDLSLVEINPLVLDTDDNLILIDAKISVDENGLMRHPNLAELQDEGQEVAAELEAAKQNMSYVRLDGNIGCMVNGAGLAMATMDIIKVYGGEPANFLDVGGGATAERVAAAFNLILSDDSVEGIFVNIFGGIVRCDLIAEGVATAVQEVGVSVPVVVRLQGNNAEKGMEILNALGSENISAEVDLAVAAELAVKVTQSA